MWLNTNTNICYSNNIQILFEYRIIRSPLDQIILMSSYDQQGVKKYFSEISGSQIHIKILDHFSTMSDHFGHFGPFMILWNILDHFGPNGLKYKNGSKLSEVSKMIWHWSKTVQSGPRFCKLRISEKYLGTPCIWSSSSSSSDHHVGGSKSCWI